MNTVIRTTFLLVFGLITAETLPVHGQIWFEEVSESRGILPNEVKLGFGGGVSAFDYDQDGDIDLYLPQRFGSPDRLYENDGNGVFIDIAGGIGLDRNESGRSALWFDYDDDHLVDLLIASDCFNNDDPDCVDKTTVRLYRQISPGTFENVTVQSGLDNAGIQQFFGHRSGICCGDIDRDGDLDLLMGQWSGDLQLFINHSGHFIDETLARGITNPNAPQPYDPWQSVMCDFNGDGWLDIFTAVDFADNQLWINQGGGQFVDMAASAGVNSAFNEMGVTLGDYDKDGDFDIFVSNIFEQEKHNLLLRNDSSSKEVQFAEVSSQGRVANTGFGWGATFLDANNDTVLDLAVTNGWFNGIGFDDKSNVFLGSSSRLGRFNNVSKTAGFDDDFFGSCLISADLNRDGDLDLLQVCHPALFEGPFRILENQWNENNTSNWLVVKPRQAGMNHWSIGAIVTVEFGKESLIRLIGAGTSIHGQEPAEAFFGLGDATVVDRIKIQWPLGGTSVWENIPANQMFTANDADLNLDGKLSLLDIYPFQQSLGACDDGCQADFNADGIVDVTDAQIFVRQLLGN